MTSNVRAWIGGEWQAIGPLVSSINPATGEVIGGYHDGSLAAGTAAIAAAKSAFDTHHEWKGDGVLRATALSRLADRFEERLDELIATITRENGKLRGEATYEVHHIVRALRFGAGLATQIFGRVLDPVHGKQSMSIRQAIGVAGIIVPWNSPGYLSIRALSPALAAGCACVLKFPGQAAQTTAVLSEIIASVPEIPVGMVNIFVEQHGEGSRLLVDSPDVDVVSFTGSTATGRAIAQAAAARLKRVGLELGGKTPHLVFADADLDKALPILVRSVTTFAGQFCMTGSRILADHSIADELRARLAERLSQIRPGPAADPASEIGPLIDRQNVERVDNEVEAAITAGAEVVVRGGPSSDPALSNGCFYRPTLLEVSDSTLPIVQNEVFGPVVVFQRFENEEEAIRLANDTEYGLSACVWSRDADRPIRVSRRLEAGFVSINSWANLQIEFEEGGWKASGLGRLGGLASLEDFLEYKQITQDFGN